MTIKPKSLLWILIITSSSSRLFFFSNRINLLRYQGWEISFLLKVLLIIWTNKRVSKLYKKW